MKKILLLAFCFSLTRLFAQVGGVVLDKSTGKPVPDVNVWVENELTGTSTDSLGNFQLAKVPLQKTLVVSSVGFETQKVLVDGSFMKISLTPKVMALKEIVVKPCKKKTYSSGEITKKKTNKFPFSWEQPVMVARYFPYESDFACTPYIKSIKVATKSENRASVFGLRILSASADGKPDSDMLPSLINVSIKEGERITKIDLEKYKLIAPETGFFIAFEWIKTEKNKYGVVHASNHKIMASGYVYNPTFMINSKKTENTGVWSYWYNKGQWVNDKPKFDLTIELTMANSL
jgi:hypothetical protein